VERLRFSGLSDVARPPRRACSGGALVRRGLLCALTVVDFQPVVVEVLQASASPGAAALIGAAAAIVGALAGAGSTYLIERKRQQFQRDEAKRVDTALMRGVARVWSKRLCDFHLLLCGVLDGVSSKERPSWWTDEHEVETEMSVDDMKRVAAAADSRQWTQIDFALSHVHAVRAARAASKSDGPTRHVDEMKKALDRIEEAANSLAEIAGDKPPKFPWKQRFGLGV
jgi:hypothetical protein